jgi:hypothetical protein
MGMGRFPAVANSAQIQVTRERLLSLSKCAPLPMNFSVLVHFTHLGKSVREIRRNDDSIPEISKSGSYLILIHKKIK